MIEIPYECLAYVYAAVGFTGWFFGLLFSGAKLKLYEALALLLFFVTLWPLFWVAGSRKQFKEAWGDD